MIPSEPVRVAVEQAVARGDTPDHICDQLHVTPTAVDAVLARMEALLAAETATVAPHGTHAAYTRHRSNDEPPCKRCRAAERTYQAAAHQRRRARAA